MNFSVGPGILVYNSVKFLKQAIPKTVNNSTGCISPSRWTKAVFESVKNLPKSDEQKLLSFF